MLLDKSCSLLIEQHAAFLGKQFGTGSISVACSSRPTKKILAEKQLVIRPDI
jgi:hypothetical protein